MIGWLFEWQTLVGALVGSAGALLVAELVSSSARWRDAHAAANQILWEFSRYAAQADALRAGVAFDQNGPSRMTREGVSLLRIRPQLSTHYPPAAARVISTDPYLARVMSMVDMLASHAERGLESACALHDRQLQGQPVGYTYEEIREQLIAGVENTVDAAELMNLAIPRLQKWSRAVAPSFLGAWYRARWRFRLDSAPTWDELQALAEEPRKVGGW